MNIKLLCIYFFIGITVCKSQDKAVFFELEKVSDEVISPVGITNAGDGSGRLFVVAQQGKILILKNGVFNKEPFLDLTNLNLKGPKLNSYSESGLLSICFHPKYKSNGRFFVYYGYTDGNGKHKTVLGEFTISKNADIADTKHVRLLEIEQPEDNHNGGGMAFGPDGMLYLGVGDGGGAGDKHGKIGNAQNKENLFGSIIRINVDAGKPYAVPKDNPQAGKKERPELWAWGLRNPWQFSFDARTGELYCGDVGQNKIEEVNIIKKGGNYGWRAYEGTRVYDKDLAQSLSSTSFIKPIAEYDHSEGMCVIGGVVYRGKQYPELTGKYIFADWKGVLFYLEKTSSGYDRFICPVKGYNYGELGFAINAIGTDESGEIYICTQEKVWKSSKGSVYKLKASAP